MEDRYSYDKEGPRRCAICGGYVHEKLVPGQGSLAEIEGEIEVERICQNQSCNSNTGQMSISDVV
jgi:hypothetical protein